MGGGVATPPSSTGLWAGDGALMTAVEGEGEIARGDERAPRGQRVPGTKRLGGRHTPFGTPS